mgnify:CR=1 FL=1
MHMLRIVPVLSVMVLFAAVSIASAVTINEFRLDQPSDDYDEYIELMGDPGESLDDLSFIVIGDVTITVNDTVIYLSGICLLYTSDAADDN